MSDPTVHHAAVTVSELDRAVEFYTDAFGFDVAAEFAVGGDAFADAVGVPGASGSFVHLDGGDAVVELVEYDPSGEPTAESSLDRPGATHIGIAVDDVDAVYAGLDKTVETLSEPRTTESGTTILFVRDPDGNLVEVLDA